MSRYVCRRTKSLNVYQKKKVYIPWLKEGRRLVQPKYAGMGGETEEYSTRKQCLRRIKTLNKTRRWP